MHADVDFFSLACLINVYFHAESGRGSAEIGKDTFHSYAAAEAPEATEDVDDHRTNNAATSTNTPASDSQFVGDNQDEEVGPDNPRITPG